MGSSDLEFLEFPDENHVFVNTKTGENGPCERHQAYGDVERNEVVNRVR